MDSHSAKLIEEPRATTEHDSDGGASSPDLHTLVAIAAHAIGKNLSHADKEDRRNPHIQTMYGIIDDTSTNRRSFRILDAIAGICIFQDKKQVVAVALKMNLRAQEIRLIVAENRKADVHPSVLLIIKSVWAKLKRLSDIYAAERLASSNSAQWDNFQGISPELKENTTAQPIIVDLVCDVYIHAWKKIIKRKAKWWPTFRLFALRFQQDTKASRKAGDGQSLADTFSKLYICLKKSMNIIHGNDRPKLGPQVWEQLTNLMAGCLSNSKVILDHPSVCETWGKEYQEGIYPVPVRRAIKKLTSLHRHIDVLIRVANSPRLRRAFMLKMVLEAVPKRATRSIPLPDTSRKWDEILQEACADESFLTPRWLASQSLTLTQAYQSPGNYAMHCECALITHLELSDSNHTPAFSYLGVSKLSCPACTIWIKEFNRSGKRRYTTKGCHGTWYWPWIVPELPGSGLTNLRTAQAVKAQLCNYFILAHDRRDAGSDSTVNSNSGTLGPSVSSFLEKIYAEIDADEQ